MVQSIVKGLALDRSKDSISYKRGKAGYMATLRNRFVELMMRR